MVCFVTGLRTSLAARYLGIHHAEPEDRLAQSRTAPFVAMRILPPADSNSATYSTGPLAGGLINSSRNAGAVA